MRVIAHRVCLLLCKFSTTVDWVRVDHSYLSTLHNHLVSSTEKQSRRVRTHIFLNNVINLTTDTELQGKVPCKSKTEISTIALFFDRPINDASKALGTFYTVHPSLNWDPDARLSADICPTVLKKICRKHGLKRWPSRRIRSIDKQLRVLTAAIQDECAEDTRLRFCTRNRC